MLLWMVAKSCIFQDSYWSHWDKKTGISYAVSGNGGYPNSIAEWFTHKKSYWLVQYPRWCVLKSWGIPRSPWVSILSMLMVIWCPIVHFFLLGQEVQVRLRLCIPESARLFLLFYLIWCSFWHDAISESLFHYYISRYFMIFHYILNLDDFGDLSRKQYIQDTISIHWY